MEIFSAIGCGCLWVSLGVGVHTLPMDKPEFSEPNPMIRAQLGYETAHAWRVTAEHISNGPAAGQHGAGFNALWIERRWNLPRGAE